MVVQARVLVLAGQLGFLFQATPSPRLAPPPRPVSVFVSVFVAPCLSLRSLSPSCLCLSPDCLPCLCLPSSLSLLVSLSPHLSPTSVSPHPWFPHLYPCLSVVSLPHLHCFPFSPHAHTLTPLFLVFPSSISVPLPLAVSDILPQNHQGPCRARGHGQASPVEVWETWCGPHPR